MPKKKKSKSNREINTSFKKAKEVLVTPQVEKIKQQFENQINSLVEDKNDKKEEIQETEDSVYTDSEREIDDEQYNLIVGDGSTVLEDKEVTNELIMEEEAFEQEVTPTVDCETKVEEVNEISELPMSGEIFKQEEVAPVDVETEFEEFIDEEVFEVVTATKIESEEYMPLEDTSYDLEVRHNNVPIIEEREAEDNEAELAKEETAQKENNKKWMIICVVLVLTLGLVFAVVLHQVRSNINDNVSLNE